MSSWGRVNQKQFLQMRKNRQYRLPNGNRKTRLLARKLASGIPIQRCMRRLMILRVLPCRHWSKIDLTELHFWPRLWGEWLFVSSLLFHCWYVSEKCVTLFTKPRIFFSFSQLFLSNYFWVSLIIYKTYKKMVCLHLKFPHLNSE